MDDAGRDLDEEDVQPDLNYLEAISQVESGLKFGRCRALRDSGRNGFAAFEVTSNSRG